MADCHHHERDRGPDESSCAQDLHELVTLEPNNQIYSSLSLQARAELESNGDMRRQSNRTASTPPVDAPVNEGFRTAFAGYRGPLSAAPDDEQSSEFVLGLDSSSHVRRIQTAEKESDNLENPMQKRHTLQRNSASTSKALNRLFCNKSPVPSGPSREPSFHPQSSELSYMRCEQTSVLVFSHVLM